MNSCSLLGWGEVYIKRCTGERARVDLDAGNVHMIDRVQLSARDKYSTTTSITFLDVDGLFFFIDKKFCHLLCSSTVILEPMNKYRIKKSFSIYIRQTLFIHKLLRLAHHKKIPEWGLG